jgi:polar amino acid transport system substrate-binding protein
MVRKILMVFLMLILVSFTVFAGGGSEEPMESEEMMGEENTPNDPRLFEPGKLTVATGEPVFPPWMMDDDPASGIGFENALVYALAAELGFAPEDVVWVRKTFDEGIAPGAKAYDFNLQQYSVTEERKEFVSFSSVYYQPEKAVVALPASGINAARSFSDLRDLRWGATIGTTDLNYLENVIGVEDVAVYSDQVGTFQALLAGQIDATVISLPTALFVTAVQVPEARVAAVLPADPNDFGFGFVFEKDNPIIPWINEGLEAIISEGVVADLTAEYLIGDDSIPEISQ